MQNVLGVRWIVTLLETPRIWRTCGRCNARRPFASSGKFRVNAQKKRLDAWLIYRCGDCEQTWNRPLLERQPLEAVAPDLLQALTANDAALARRYAFDLAGLPHQAPPADFAAVRLEKRLEQPCERPALLRLALVLPHPCGLRLDRLLAGGFGIARGTVQRLPLTLEPALRKPFSQPLRDGLGVKLDLAALPADVAGRILAAAV